MEYINLKKFCGLCKSNTEKPYIIDNYIYATDGSILIRVNKTHEVEIQKECFQDITYIKEKTIKILADNPIVGNEIWIDLPTFKNEEIPCGTCKGSDIQSLCQECDGTGSVELKNEYNTYNCECLSCNGKVFKKNSPCKECNGEKTHKIYVSVKIDEDIIVDGILETKTIILNGRYLEMLRDLPGIEISIDACIKDPENVPVKFKFNNGIGLLMTMSNTR